MVCGAGLLQRLQLQTQRQGQKRRALAAGSHLCVLDPHLAPVPRQTPPVAPVVAVGAERQAPNRVLLQPLLQGLLRPPHRLLLLVFLTLLGLFRLALQAGQGRPR